MKRLYILILTLSVIIAFTACKKNRDSNIVPDNPARTENESAENICENNDLRDDKENSSNEINISDNDDEHIDQVSDINDDIISGYIPSVHYYIIGDVVRMREDASLESNTLYLLNQGTKVEYIDRKGDWIKVKYDDEIGYIRNDLLSENMPIEETTEENVEETEEETIEEANNPTEVTNNPLGEIVNPKIIVKKADRVLQLLDGENLRATYPIGLGWEPVGDKEKEGDGKTPEGTYYVCTRNNFSRFYLSLGLSYPNKEDAYEGLEAGLIDQSTYNQIEDAINREEQPPWNTALGGEIMIHGHGSHSDWTAGCIAVDNEIMDILWEHCRIGTSVVIEP